MDKITAAVHAFLVFKLVGVVPVYFPFFVTLLGVANQLVKVAKWTTAERVIELGCRMILKIPAVGVFITAIPLLGDLLRAMANDTENLPPTLLSRIKSAKKPSVPPAAVALLMIGLVSLSACAPCKLAVNVAVPKCVLERNLVSCGVTDGYALIPVVVKLAGDLLAGKPFDANALALELEKQGFHDVPCLLAALETYVGSSTLPNKEELKGALHNALVASLAKSGHHGSVTVKLKSGLSVLAVVP